MIKFDNVSKRYDNGDYALKHVSFNLERGEMVFLTGHSGAGKSTLLQLIGLFIRPSAGLVLLNQHVVNDIPAKQIPTLRQSMGIALQNPHLLPERTVFENVAMPLIIAGFNRADMANRVKAALDKVNLASKAQYYPAMLSSGEAQRVSIARAIVHKPTILLADEPTGNLDPDLSFEIMKLFEAFHAVGTTVIVASHNLDLVEKFPYRTLALQRGVLSEAAYV